MIGQYFDIWNPWSQSVKELLLQTNLQTNSAVTIHFGLTEMEWNGNQLPKLDI